MKKQSAFWKIISLLSHPTAILAITLLLINDWILRIYWPSWWTGKIGDFAWLFFFPFLLAAILSIFLPSRTKDQEKTIKVLAFVLTGLIFTLPNSIPSINAILNQLLESVLGLPTDIRTDPTDLIALISLPLAWRIWDGNINRQITNKHQGWIWLQAGIILTIANAPAQDFGIVSIGIIDDQIVAHSAYYEFASEDGGITWDSEYVQPSEREYDPIENEYLKIEYQPGEIIKISKDGGETYPIEYSLVPVKQPLSLKYQERKGSPVFKQGPMDATFDPVSGNILFAMGHEGVLVFTENEEWTWVSVEDYQRLTYEPRNEFYTLLFGEFLLAIFFALMIVNTFTFRIHKGRGRIFIVAFGWIVFYFYVTVYAPALFNSKPGSYYSLHRLVFYIVQMFWVISYFFLGLLDLIRIYTYSKQIVRNIALLSITGIFIFITPYIFWSFNIIPLYTTASILASLIGAVMIIVVYFSMFGKIDEYSNAIHESLSKNK